MTAFTCAASEAPAIRAGAFSWCLPALLAVAFACSGCAVPAQPEPVWAPVQSLLERRQNHVVTQRWDLSCGAAAMATLMNYQHGEAFTEKAVAESMLRRSDPLTVRIKGGFSLLDMKRFAQRQGYRGRGFMQLQFDQLLASVPAIVPVELGGYRHFVIVRGAVADRVLLADPAFGNRSLRESEFRSAWLAGIAFVVERRDGLAPPVRLGIEAVDFLRVPESVIRQAVR